VTAALDREAAPRECRDLVDVVVVDLFEGRALTATKSIE